MRLRAKLLGASVGVLAAGIGGAGTANAAFPNYSDCPSGATVLYCIDIQSVSGFMDIKGFRVPIGNSLEIRGGLASPDGSTVTFVAPTGKTGVFAKPIQVPGGILGIDFPLPGNAVTATAELAGAPSSLRVSLDDFSVAMPMKLKLTNPIIGPGCSIGSNSNPANVRLNLTRLGTGAFDPTAGLTYTGNTNVDRTFAIPGASGCGIGLGLINSLINLKLKLPSSSGNNTLSIDNNFGFKSK